MGKKKETEIFMRNFIFGVEDSLVSTVGLLSGIAAAGMTKTDIFLTGVVLVFVEAFSMGVGSFLSEDTIEDQKTKANSKRAPVGGAVIMFISYICAGLIPLAPYILFPTAEAFILSIAFSLVALFFLGVVSAYQYNRPLGKLGIRMLVMGGLAILVGIGVGNIVPMISTH